MTQARRWLEESGRVLIGAGAGMSASAGIDYADTATFAQLFPAFVRMGFRAQYQLIGYGGLTPAQHWGYWSTHVKHVRFGQDARAAYADLRQLVSGRDTFVLTSNVDMLFPRNGFDEARLFTPQGDYARMQCRKPCARETWPTRPFIERCLESLDPVTQQVTDPEALPRCPQCGGAVFMNVRVDAGFVEEPYIEQAQRFRQWVGQGSEGRLLVIEIGAGFNTPSVVRWRMEHLVHHHLDARLIRINPLNPELPEELTGRAVSLEMGAVEALAALREA
ncbi:NAD-dependent protein deacetylase of SIR2 family [Corallococcus sp. AB038B]|uniref:SIR2 family NAD-dependent protein deacylase n=1 Tax=Corallococcus sp. AB038B TaxID=2316718 RepID=UPI001F34E00C|nr:NAD-dependent protein deacetylase of SIR2 family [Corallococcus sp. AB038B]